jgi:hypothetical protein
MYASSGEVGIRDNSVDGYGRHFVVVRDEASRGISKIKNVV